MIEIIKAYLPLFILTVILPILVGGVGAYVGWDSLRTKLEENKLKERTLHIRQLIEKTKNGDRSAYKKLNKIHETHQDITNEEAAIIEVAYDTFHRMVEAHLREKSKLTLIKLETKKPKKWSLEYLYFLITYDNDMDSRFAAINYIGKNKHEYLVQALYQLAINNNKNILLSVSACQAICMITNYAPYEKKYGVKTSPEKRISYDSPNFLKLKEWWEKEGKNNEKYTCPLGDLIDNDRNYYFYHRKTVVDSEKRLEDIKKILSTYPQLARTRAEMAYLLLGKENTFEEVEQNALEALKGTDAEVLPYLLFAYVAWKKNQPANVNKWISSAYEMVGVESLLTCVRINEKFHILFNIVAEFCFEKHKKHKNKMNP